MFLDVLPRSARTASFFISYSFECNRRSSPVLTGVGIALVGGGDSIGDNRLGPQGAGSIGKVFATLCEATLRDQACKPSAVFAVKLIVRM